MNRAELLQIAKPILFNAEMVRAILDDRKTMTRRVIKPQPPKDVYPVKKLHEDGTWILHWWDVNDPHYIKIPYSPRDILYVQETWNYGYIETSDIPEKSDTWFEPVNPNSDCGGYIKALSTYFYKGDEDAPGRDIGMIWRPSIHMPKEAARIFLRVTDVRVERLQEIAPSDVVKEGAYDDCIPCIESYGSGSQCDYKGDDECSQCDSVIMAWEKLWNSTIKKSDLDRYGWDANPWVWVIEFERVDAN